MGKCRKFLGLSRPEQGAFFLALLLLPITALALRLLGLRRTQALLIRLSPTPGLPEQDQKSTLHQQTLEIARVVRAAANHGPYHANCLKQSLVLWWLLRLRGIGSSIRIGVSRGADRMEAHAWVECGGRPLNDREDVALRFTPFHRAIVTG